MMHARLGDIRDFPFIDKPDSRMINDGYKLLQELQAGITKALTKLGKMLVAIPLDPKFARMLLEASRLGSLTELMIITSGLSIQDPRERPADKKQAIWRISSGWMSNLILCRYSISGSILNNKCRLYRAISLPNTAALILFHHCE